jgi:isoquinoline 1-oxidoreductase alpha subunit
MVDLTLNGTPTSLDVPPEMPLLWAIREQAGLTGTKFGCGIGACGACTVHLDGEPVRSCSLPAGAAAGRSVTTIEGLADANGLHPVQAAWIR